MFNLFGIIVGNSDWKLRMTGNRNGPVWTEAVVGYLKVLFHHLPGDAEGNSDSVRLVCVRTEIQTGNLSNYKS